MCCARHGPNLLSITVCCVIWHANPPILPDWNGYRLLNAVGGNDNYMTEHWSLPRVKKKKRINELNTLHLFDDEGKQYQMWHLAGDLDAERWRPESICSEGEEVKSWGCCWHSLSDPFQLSGVGSFVFVPLVWEYRFQQEATNPAF